MRMALSEQANLNQSAIAGIGGRRRPQNRKQQTAAEQYHGHLATFISLASNRTSILRTKASLLTVPSGAAPVLPRFPAPQAVHEEFVPSLGNVPFHIRVYHREILRASAASSLISAKRACVSAMNFRALLQSMRRTASATWTASIGAHAYRS
jgi:hypothetical protein